MDVNFWHQRWERGEIGFHENEGNALLKRHLEALALTERSRIFVPLCGKSRDVAYLLAKGFSVVGVELSPLAVNQLFEELGLTPEVSQEGGYVHYRVVNHRWSLDVWVGDIFDLRASQLGVVDAVYDRAALVALPETVRSSYVKHIADICGHIPQLLVCYEYDQSLMSGPPFSIGPDKVEKYYGTECQYVVTLLSSLQVSRGLKSISNVMESVWLIR